MNMITGMKVLKFIMILIERVKMDCINIGNHIKCELDQLNLIKISSIVKIGFRIICSINLIG